MSNPSLPSPSLPPKIPTRSLTPVVLGFVGVVVVVGGGLWALSRSSGDEPEPEPEAPAAEARPTPEPAPSPAASAAEPPPPPPPEEAVAGKPGKRPASMGAQIAPARGEAAPKVASAKRDPNCDDPCRGRETPELLSALGGKARQARSCYERALSNDSTLSGRIEVVVRVSPTGAACSASSSKDTLGDSVVSSCVLQRFRSGSYPKPTGGCVNVSVPINFMPAGAR
jgi:outer membrane biosynthesis protein TonB